MADKPGIGVGVMMLNSKGELLLGRRVDDQRKSALKGGGTWTMPGGKLEFGERLEEAAVREVKEETGLDVVDLQIISVADDIIPGKHYVTIGFLGKPAEEKTPVVDQDPDCDIVEWKWFPLDALPSPLFFPSERVLKNYLAKRVYWK